jgi:hypothetical protein
MFSTHFLKFYMINCTKGRATSLPSKNVSLEVPNRKSHRPHFRIVCIVPVSVRMWEVIGAEVAQNDQ